MSAQLICATAPPTSITQNFLEKVFLVTLENIDWQPSGDISVAFVNTAKSRQLNKQFAGNDYATDVLSFAYDEAGMQLEGNISGEIVICTDIARSQATEYTIDLSSEIALLLSHGLIHLSGKDHHSKSTQASFESLQGAIIKTLKLQYRKMPYGNPA